VGEIHSLSRETASRVLEAARLYRLLDRPTVIASGGEETVGRGAPESRAMAHELQGLGVPENRILQDPGSQDTHEQALEMVGFLSDRGLERFVLVTSAEHMTRALGAFREVGLDPVPSSPSADPEDDSASMGARWWPQESSLEVSRTALREYLALLYYWARGWLAIQ
jgi:uncharacterized SAM-binding protein YcdF (DUF218 family)